MQSLERELRRVWEAREQFAHRGVNGSFEDFYNHELTKRANEEWAKYDVL
jgi:hypothetical protein